MPRLNGKRLLFIGRHGRYSRITKSVIIGAVVTLFVVCIGVPLVFHHSSRLQRQFVFLHTVMSSIDFDKPENVGLPGTRNFYITTDGDISLGVWHVLPESLAHSSPEDADDRVSWFESSLGNKQPIFIYLHGNKGSRGETHRVEMYNILRKLECHVITFDYRGYGDSSHIDPSEEGLVEDAKTIFRYVKKKAGLSPVFLWAHSLGTGVSCHASPELCVERDCPDGLVLEAPFTSLRDEVLCNPMSQMFRYLPYFEWAFIQPLNDIGLKMQSDKYITQIPAPILILHAVDDHIVPVELGRKLHETAKEGRSPKAPPVELVEFEPKFGYGHNHISRAPELPGLIRKFISDAKKY